MARDAGSYGAQLPGVEKSVEILSFRGPVEDNLVQDQTYVEHNHSVSLNEDLTRFPNGGGSAWCLTEKLCPFCSFLVPLDHIMAQSTAAEEE